MCSDSFYVVSLLFFIVFCCGLDWLIGTNFTRIDFKEYFSIGKFFDFASCLQHIRSALNGTVSIACYNTYQIIFEKLEGGIFGTGAVFSQKTSFSVRR